MKMKKTILTTLLLVCISCSLYAQKGYEKSIELGGAFGVDEFKKKSFEIDMINGYRFNDYFSLGAGLGFCYTSALIYKTYSYEGLGEICLMPLYGRIKTNFTNSNVSPFILVDLGYTFDLGENFLRKTYDLMIEPAFGVDFKLNEKKLGFYFFVGYNLQNASYTYMRELRNYLEKGTAESISIKGGIRF
ncbi:outer membrane beta-barrel protein [Bacteroides sedimenti]|uniref:Outer membrane protein beta-barrel domain-containing protein n=1 Tax=Bacteroides sedimenti TaxID=2136147 RepID=A0ABM8IEB4_9BACE